MDWHDYGQCYGVAMPPCYQHINSTSFITQDLPAAIPLLCFNYNFTMQHKMASSQLLCKGNIISSYCLELELWSWRPYIMGHTDLEVPY